MSTKKTSPKASPKKKAAKPPAPKLPRAVAANKRDFAKRLAEFERRRARPMSMLEAFAKVATFLGAAIVHAITTPDEAVRAAGGDLVEAMGGHRCGPDCWHAPEGTAAEKQAWWDKRLADFDARVARTEGTVRTAAGAQASAEASRCQAMHQTTPEVQQGIKMPHGIPTQCVHSTGHKGAHQNAAWRDGKPGGVSWWS